MSSTKIETIGGMTVNLADVKCFIVPEDDRRNTLVIQFKTRHDYIRNPETDQYEKQEYNETVDQGFYSYDSLIAHRNEWIAAWKKYLDENM